MKWICTILVISFVYRFQAQTILYSESFNTNLGTSTSLNPANGSWIWTNSCARSALPGHTAPGSAFFSGIGCFFGNSGLTVSGNLVTPTIAIGPAGGILTFNYLRLGETVFFWDVLSVQVSNNNGLSYTTILNTGSGGGLTGYDMMTPTLNIVWNQACYNLSSYANQTILVRFNFNSLDGILNDFDGVYVDDILIMEPYPLTAWQSTNNVCPGTAVTLSTNAVGSFSWSTGATTPIIVVTPTVTTTYSINSCSGAAGGLGSLVVNVTPQLSLTIASSSANSVVCTGALVNLSATVFGGTPGYSYNWQGTAGNSTFSATQNTQGVYIFTATVTDANTCSMTQTATLSFIQSPTLTSIPGQTICPGTTATIITTGADTYTWLPSGINSNSIVVSPTTQSTYSVTGTNTITGCTNSGTTEIHMKPTPTLAISQASITCGALGFGTVTPIGGIGVFSYTWSPSNQTTAIANNLNTSIYTITVFDAGTGCITTATTQYTPLTPLTGQLNNDTILLCHNIPTGAAHFTNLANGSGTEFYLWDNGTTTYTASSPSNLNIGTWSVTVSDALTACQIFSVFTITQPPALSLTISSPSPTTCVGTTLHVTATNSGGTPGTNPSYTYTWVNGPSSSTTTISENIAGIYVYTVNSLDSNACISTQTIAVDFVPNPIVSVSNVSICPLEIGTLTAIGATSYTWQTPALLNITGSSFTNAPISSEQYTLVGSQLSCTSSTTAYIIVKPTPNAPIFHNAPLCEGQNLYLNTAPHTAFMWQGPNFFFSSTQTNTFVNAQPTQSGVYSLTITAANSCTAASSVSITVKPLPQFSISPQNSSICLSTTSVSLTIAASLAANVYQWLPNNGLSTTSGSVVNAFPTANTIYTITGTLNGCTSSTQSTVNVVPPPSLSAQLSSNTLCSQAFNGSPNTITLTAGGASTYTLTTFPDMFNANPGGPVSALTAIPPYSGAGSATLSGSNGVCTVTTTLTFSILPNPTVTINNYTPVICAGQSFTYTNQGANTYTWSSSTPGSTLFSTGNVAVANPSINSVFSVYGGSLGCNSPLQTTSITVNPLPQVSVSPNPANVCIGGTVALHALSNGTSFLWLPPFGLNTYTVSDVVSHMAQNQSYTVIATLNNCSNTAVGMVSVMPLPTPNIMPIKDEVCLKEKIHLNGQGGIYYEWTAPNAQTFSVQSLQVVAAHMQFSGTFTLKVVDANSCSAYSTHPVVVHDLPNGYLEPTRFEFCVPYCNKFQFKASPSSQNILAGNWSLDGQLYSSDSFSICFTEDKTYNITGPISDAFNCKNTVSLIVIGRPKPTAAFYVTPENPVEGLDEVSFVNITSNIIDYTWQASGLAGTSSFAPSTGSGAGNGMTQNTWMSFTSEEQNPAYVFEEAGVYGLMLMVKNEFNCWDTVMKTIKVESDFAAYIPNAFTPNGDGLNDTFYPVLRGVKTCELQIFDRWGEVIFSSTSPEQAWDGTFKGEACKQDVYNYKLVLLNVKKEEKVYSGSILLYR